MKRNIVILLCAVLACTSCGGQGKTKRTAVAQGTTADGVKIYSPPAIPAIMSDPEERARWVAEHWWDGFDFADTLSVARWGEYTEQAFVDFDYGLLMQVPQEISEGAIGVLFRRAGANKDVFWKFAEIAEKYLYDGNSPARNEELYIPVLRAVLANPALDEWERMRPEEQLRLTLKNRVGDAANDFRYTLASGATGTLYGLRAPFTLLFFNNPGCPTCRSMMDTIAATPYLQNLIEAGTLKVLAVYTDEDLTAWRDYLPQMPEGWIASYDAARTIPTEDLYDLKAIPTLYLLDAGKRVLLKDEMSIPRIEQTIYNLQQQ
jgi:thiol-disulfide isomerase/thioredoxin